MNTSKPTLNTIKSLSKAYKKGESSDHDDRKSDGCMEHKYEESSNDKTLNGFFEMGFNRNEVLQCIHDVRLRLLWNVDSMCLIYSRRNGTWFKGRVFAINVDKNTQEWLIVKYNNANTKRMQRFNNNIKPIGLSYESNKALIQIICNKLKSKELTLHTLNQTTAMSSDQHTLRDSIIDPSLRNPLVFEATKDPRVKDLKPIEQKIAGNSLSLHRSPYNRNLSTCINEHALSDDYMIKLKQFQTQITAYAKQNNMDGAVFNAMNKESFSQSLCNYSNVTHITNIVLALYDGISVFDCDTSQRDWQHDTKSLPPDKKDAFIHKISSKSNFDDREHQVHIHTMSWKHIANCIHHEMFPALANTLRSIIDEKDEFEVYDRDLETHDIETMIQVLKTKRKLAVEEREYVRKLCQRAVQFVPITAHNRRKQSSDDGDVDFESDNRLNTVLLQDIFDVHRHFRFSHYHFGEYTIHQYSSDLMYNVDDKYVDLKSVVNKAMVKERFSFYPSYIIYDNMFEVFDYVFNVSQYMHYIRNNLKNNINVPFSLKLVIIPKSVRSVYDEHIVFPSDIGYIDDYLRSKNVFEYQRVTNSINFKRFLKNEYVVDSIEEYLMIIIDRRYSVDTMYILRCTTFNHFKELNGNYFLGFVFHVIPTGNHENTVVAYLRYGMNEKLRFYPEMMLSIIPRSFKRPSDIPESEILHKMYSNKYKHGFSLELNDTLFNKYYKIITRYNHVSVNINRTLLVKEYSAAKEILFFRDLLQYEMCISHLDTDSIKEATRFIVGEEYDSEAIIDDINGNTSSNIRHYFISNGKQSKFDIIRTIVSKYTDPSEYNKPKQCCADNIFDLKDCKYIDYLLETLRKFNDSEFIVNVNEYNICDLLNAYDHMIDVHQFNRFQNNIHIKSYFADKNGYCLLEDCYILEKHRMRRRERERPSKEPNKDSNDDGTEDSINEILSATLIAMHCYISHKDLHLFRLERSKDNLHFITPKDEDDDKTQEKTDKALSMKFGVSVLEWLKYDEKPTFSSFKEEIVSNKHSTINQRVYLSFVRECFIKLINRKYEQYTLDEMMSLKIYTDTDVYQSAFRKSFWKSSSVFEKRSFYHWGMQLYETAVFHSKPTPRMDKTSKGPISIFHGLNMVFVLDNGLPMYNGPISTSLQKSVAHSFSQGTGLLWTIKPSYANKFKFVTGIDVSWISHHKNEAEFLLSNQYLPIVSTLNFDNDINNNVDHMLYSLKSFKTPITNIDKFYRVIGLVYKDESKTNNNEKHNCNPEWIDNLHVHPLSKVRQKRNKKKVAELEDIVEKGKNINPQELLEAQKHLDRIRSVENAKKAETIADLWKNIDPEKVLEQIEVITDRDDSDADYVNMNHVPRTGRRYGLIGPKAFADLRSGLLKTTITVNSDNSYSIPMNREQE